MKNTILSIVIGFIVVFSSTLQSQVKLLTESTARFDKVDNTILTQRIELTMSKHVFMKYDFNNNLHGKTVADVGMVSFTNAISTKSFLFEPSIITLGDLGNREMETFVDLYSKFTHKNFSFSVDFGIGYSPITAPRYFVLHRFSSKYVTVEGGFVSKNGPKTVAEMADSKYGWIAFHPKHFYLAVGNEIKTSWFFAGTKEMKDFGNFSFASFNRTNDDFWFRSQTGLLDVNQKFFCQDNYIVGTSYLTIPPFFYKHFSPISTKGLWSFKVDMKRSGSVERKEVIIGHQFGSYGQVAIGFQNQLSDGNGAVLEYFNSITSGAFSSSVELKYETLLKRVSAFVVASYQF